MKPGTCQSSVKYQEWILIKSLTPFLIFADIFQPLPLTFPSCSTSDGNNKAQELPPFTSTKNSDHTSGPYEGTLTPALPPNTIKLQINHLSCFLKFFWTFMGACPTFARKPHDVSSKLLHTLWCVWCINLNTQARIFGVWSIYFRGVTRTITIINPFMLGKTKRHF